ncbi:unnamed protein product [Linum tenue]|uniref:Uncharacterized protein n=1 Tax=Linum tenue TaxID=586396 RepID=A0AAV0IAZ8_9ROSI|nr:unnamed protein product [Linum tenue]
MDLSDFHEDGQPVILEKAKKYLFKIPHKSGQHMLLGPFWF